MLPPTDPAPTPPPPRLGHTLVRLEREFLRPYRWTFLLALVGLLGQSLLLLPIPVIQGLVLDQLVLSMGPAGRAVGAARGASAAIVLALVAMALCHAGRAALAWAVGTTLGRISQEVVVMLRTRLHQKLMRLPMAYFDAQQTGRLMARVTSDVGSILSFVNSGLLQLLGDLLVALGIAVVLCWLQWRLALVALVIVPLYAVNRALFARRIHRVTAAIRQQVAALYALLSEKVTAVRIVRAFAREADELAAVDRRIDAHRALAWQNTRLGAWLSAAATIISGIGSVAVITQGAILVGQGAMSVGELLAFYGLIGQLYGPIVRLSQFQTTVLATGVSLERLFEVLDEPEPVADRPDARPILRPRGALRYEGVSFRYRPDGPDVLREVDLRIEPGMTLGLLGPSGAGKSTLLALAPRLYDVPEGCGAVRFDGQDVRELRLSDLRRLVALVSQEPLLFEGTIRSNLAYARPDAGERDLWLALERADLAETVRAWPQGLDAPVGERGRSLSGGQRQRLALARALAADPRVLLLDDCTSALDAETEARIQEALRDRSQGRTLIIVSHKVSSVCHADRIVVLRDGRVVEEGTHDALLGRGGEYTATHATQAEALSAGLAGAAANPLAALR